MANMKIYKRKTKGGNYYCSFSLRGKQWRVSLRTSNKEDAQTTAAAVYQRAVNGNDRDRHKLTLKGILNNYEEYLYKRSRLSPTTKQQLQWWATLPCMNDTILTITDIVSALDLASEAFRWENSTYNRYLAVLSAAFNHAIRMELRNDNPVKKIKRKPEQPRERWLTEAEIDKLDDYLLMTRDVWLRLAFNLAVGTGIRAGELLALCWKDIDFNKQQIHVRGETTKNNKPRTVFMGTNLCQLFRKIERSECWIPIDPVFPGSFSYYHLNTCAKRLSNHVSEFKWHDLRHTYAVHCVKNGMDLPTLAKLLGHKSTKVTERYANFAPTHEHVRKFTPNF